MATVAAMRVRYEIVRPRESTIETQPQLQPALLRLSAIISQYFERLFTFRHLAWARFCD